MPYSYFANGARTYQQLPKLLDAAIPVQVYTVHIIFHLQQANVSFGRLIPTNGYSSLASLSWELQGNPSLANIYVTVPMKGPLTRGSSE